MVGFFEKRISAAEVRDRSRAAHGAFYATMSLPVQVYLNRVGEGLKLRCNLRDVRQIWTVPSEVAAAVTDTVGRRGQFKAPTRRDRPTG